MHKDKGTKLFFWNSRGEDHAVVKGVYAKPSLVEHDQVDEPGCF